MMYCLLLTSFYFFTVDRKLFFYLSAYVFFLSWWCLNRQHDDGLVCFYLLFLINWLKNFCKKHVMSFLIHTVILKFNYSFLLQEDWSRGLLARLPSFTWPSMPALRGKRGWCGCLQVTIIIHCLAFGQPSRYDLKKQNNLNHVSVKWLSVDKFKGTMETSKYIYRWHSLHFFIH